MNASESLTIEFIEDNTGELTRQALDEAKRRKEAEIEATRCPECQLYHGHHRPPCSLVTVESLRKDLESSQWLENHNRTARDIQFRRMTEQLTFWQGKFHAVKHENNKLRARTRLAAAALDEGYQAVEAALGPEGVRALVEERNTAQARVGELERMFADERKHSEWLQGECNKAVDDVEWANGKKAKATRLVAELTQRLAEAGMPAAIFRAVLEGAEFENLDKLADAHVDFARMVGQAAAARMKERVAESAQAEAQAATLLPVTEASLKYFEAVEKGASLSEQQRLWLLWDCAVIKYRAALAPETKEETNVLR